MNRKLKTTALEGVNLHRSRANQIMEANWSLISKIFFIQLDFRLRRLFVQIFRKPVLVIRFLPDNICSLYLKSY